MEELWLSLLVIRLNRLENVISITDQYRDLGIIITSNMNYSLLYETISAKAYRILGYCLEVQTYNEGSQDQKISSYTITQNSPY